MVRAEGASKSARRRQKENAHASVEGERGERLHGTPTASCEGTVGEVFEIRQTPARLPNSRRGVRTGTRVPQRLQVFHPEPHVGSTLIHPAERSGPVSVMRRKLLSIVPHAAQTARSHVLRTAQGSRCDSVWEAARGSARSAPGGSGRPSSPLIGDDGCGRWVRGIQLHLVAAGRGATYVQPSLFRIVELQLAGSGQPHMRHIRPSSTPTTRLTGHSLGLSR